MIRGKNSNAYRVQDKTNVSWSYTEVNDTQLLFIHTLYHIAPDPKVDGVWANQVERVSITLLQLEYILIFRGTRIFNAVWILQTRAFLRCDFLRSKIVY